MVDVSGILMDDPKMKICGTLLTQEGEPVVEDGQINMSPYSVVLLK